jgi:hypothetical protein
VKQLTTLIFLLIIIGCQDTTSNDKEKAGNSNEAVVQDNGDHFLIGDISYYKDSEHQMKMVWGFLTENQQISLKKIARTKGYRITDVWNTSYISPFPWPNGIVYYRLNQNISHVRNNIEKAMEWWENVSGLRFIETTNSLSAEFILVSGSTSSSPVGWHYNQIKISEYSTNSLGIIAHEIGHTIGMGHEQNRPDRDSYIDVHWENLPTDKDKFQYRRVRYEAPFIPWGWTGSIGYTITPYDWVSIMHYRESSAFTPKITLPYWIKNRIGQRSELSLYDGYTANTFYPGATPADPVITSNQAIGPQGTTQHWNRTLTLTWSKSTLPITVYYDLYIENQNINYLKLYKDLKATSHTITVPEYTSYSWKVVAKTYGSSYTTDKKYFNVFDPNPPASVVPEISISNNPPSPRIYWTAISGATSYEIARSENGTNYSVVKTTSNSEWIDSSQTIGSGRPDKTIYYKVRAYVSGQWHNYSSHQGVGVKNSVEEF